MAWLIEINSIVFILFLSFDNANMYQRCPRRQTYLGSGFELSVNGGILATKGLTGYQFSNLSFTMFSVVGNASSSVHHDNNQTKIRN
jgi:hypothetical protein